MKTLLMSVMTWVAVILGVVGLGVIVWGLWRMVLAGRARRWPTVQGIVISSRVVQRDAPPRAGEDFSSGGRPPPPQTLYRAEVKYRYTVDGRELHGDRVMLDDLETSSEAYARRISDRYQAGAPVTVYRDPSKPERSLLEPGVHSGAWLFPGVGLALVIVAGGLGAFVRWWFSHKVP